MISRNICFSTGMIPETGETEAGSFAKLLRSPPEPATPPVKEPAREPEDPHAPLQEPDPDPVRPAQI